MMNDYKEDYSLGYWHYEYELKQYFSKTLVGRKVNTNGWGFKEYAEAWCDNDIEGYSMRMENSWTGGFREGVIKAHKDFTTAINNYQIGYDLNALDVLRVYT